MEFLLSIVVSPLDPAKIFLDGLSAIKKQQPHLGGGFKNIFYFHPYLGKIPIFD